MNRSIRYIRDLSAVRTLIVESRGSGVERRFVNDFSTSVSMKQLSAPESSNALIVWFMNRIFLLDFLPSTKFQLLSVALEKGSRSESSLVAWNVTSVESFSRLISQVWTA